MDFDFDDPQQATLARALTKLLRYNLNHVTHAKDHDHDIRRWVALWVGTGFVLTPDQGDACVAAWERYGDRIETP